MSTIRLNDVWRRFNEEIGFYTNESFKNVPFSPGVYAWFYPLRVVTTDLYEFLREVDIILNYDSEIKGKPKKENFIKFSWDTFHQQVELRTKTINLSSFEDIWNAAIQNENEFDELRKVIMRASVFLSPLYVGKTNNLNYRCHQHIFGTADDNNFHKRFMEYATLNEVKTDKISDLLFVAIKTREEKKQLNKTEELVESILKYLAKPKYSQL